MYKIVKKNSNLLNIKNKQTLTPNKVFLKNTVSWVHIISLPAIVPVILNFIYPINIFDSILIMIFTVMVELIMATFTSMITDEKNLFISNNKSHIYAPYNYLIDSYKSKYLSSVGAYFGSDTSFLEETLVDNFLIVKNLKYLQRAIMNNKELSDKFAKLFLLLSTEKFISQENSIKSNIFLEMFKELLLESLDDIDNWNKSHSKRTQIIIIIDFTELLNALNIYAKSYDISKDSHNCLSDKINNCNENFITFEHFLGGVIYKKIKFDSNFKMNFLKNNLHLLLNDVEIISNLNKFFDNLEDYCFLANLSDTEVKGGEIQETEIIKEIYTIESFKNDFKELK